MNSTHSNLRPKGCVTRETEGRGPCFARAVTDRIVGLTRLLARARPSFTGFAFHRWRSAHLKNVVDFALLSVRWRRHVDTRRQLLKRPVH